MSHPPTRAGAPSRACIRLAATALLAIAPAAAAAESCFNAYVEIQPPPDVVCNQGWAIPATGTWTEVWPVPGRQHPQYAFNDYDLDGLIGHAESFIEAPAGAPWYIAGVGTMYHLTPVTMGGPEGPVPIGDPIVAWSDMFWCLVTIRSDNRPWFTCPDTLVVVGPACCERMRIADYLAGGVVGNGPPLAFATGDLATGDLAWWRIDSKTCGLWVAPDLATPATRRSWGSLKTIAR